MNKYEIIITEKNTKIIKLSNEDGSQTWIPFHPSNSDYQAYLKWLEEQPTA